MSDAVAVAVAVPWRGTGGRKKNGSLRPLSTLCDDIARSLDSWGQEYTVRRPVGKCDWFLQQYSTHYEVFGIDRRGETFSERNVHSEQRAAEKDFHSRSHGYRTVMRKVVMRPGKPNVEEVRMEKYDVARTGW